MVMSLYILAFAYIFFVIVAYPVIGKPTSVVGPDLPELRFTEVPSAQSYIYKFGERYFDSWEPVCSDDSQWTSSILSCLRR
ncbi:hypothetical protein V1524DRAFT_437586 [Lipomyces starkeyi]